MSVLSKVAKATRVLATSNPLLRSALTHGVAASVEHFGFLRTISPGAVVDIGANRGQFALAARHCYPKAEIHSFEPLDGPAATFREVFADDVRVHLHQAAVAPTSGSAQIHVSARDDSSSLLPIGEQQLEHFPGTGEVGTAEVALCSLADVPGLVELDGPVLLKLDVQGFELDALRGCEAVLDRVCWIYCECSFVELYEGQALVADVVAYLASRQFRLSAIHNAHSGSGGAVVQGDLVFERTVCSAVDGPITA